MKINFFEVSLGSLQESRYLLEFSCKEAWIENADEYDRSMQLAKEIAAMLWKTIENLRREP